MPVRENEAGTLEVLLITSRETRRWVIPKGWPMKGVSHAKAAAIEAMEEAGVTGPVSKRRIGSYHYDKIFRPGAPRRLKVQVFLMAVEKELDDWPEAEQRERSWQSPPEAAAMVAEPDLARLLLRLFRAARALQDDDASFLPGETSSDA